jgi:hypothetical protein
MTNVRRQETQHGNDSPMQERRLSGSSRALGERSSNSSHPTRPVRVATLVDASTPPSKSSTYSSSQRVAPVPIGLGDASQISRRRRAYSNVDSAGLRTRTNEVFIDSEPPKIASQSKSTRPFIPPRPDFDALPYIAPLGLVFHGPEWEKLESAIDDDGVVTLLAICHCLATIINYPLSALGQIGMGGNVLELGPEGVREVTKSCWQITYILLTGNWTWDALVEEQFLIDTVKRNVRMSQTTARFDAPCSLLLDLGFTEEWLFPY